jgi:hypothetical protein
MIVENATTTISNNLWIDICPCCQSTALAKIGAIKYANNPTYSSSHIKLSEVPELWRCDRYKSWFTQNRVPKADSIALYSLGDLFPASSIPTDHIIVVLKKLK